MAIKVLLVDDDHDQIIITTRALIQKDAYDIVSTENGATGLAKALNEPYDVVLCDYRLPDMTGLDVLHAFKQHGKDVPFILITAAGNERVAVEAMREGASDYVVKDAVYEEFLPSVIQRALKRVQERRQRERLEAGRRQAEEQLQSANAELRDQGQKLLSALTDLKTSHEDLKVTQAQLIQSEKLAAIGRLASGIAHEVKNPLGIIAQGISYLKAELGQDGERAEVLGLMEGAVVRADTIIRGLLDFSRPAKMELKIAAIDTVIREALRLVEQYLTVSSITVSKEFAQPLPPVRIDENQMKQVFINLIQNAFQAMPNGGRLAIRAQARTLTRDEPKTGRRAEDIFHEGETVVACDVQDSGAGISREHLDQLFEPFFTTKPPGQGTGLGLAITRQIIESHGGTVRVTSEPGRGTIFSVLLPVAKEGTA